MLVCFWFKILLRILYALVINFEVSFTLSGSFRATFNFQSVGMRSKSGGKVSLLSHSSRSAL